MGYNTCLWLLHFEANRKSREGHRSGRHAVARGLEREASTGDHLLSGDIVTNSMPQTQILGLAAMVFNTDGKNRDRARERDTFQFALYGILTRITMCLLCDVDVHALL